MWTTKVFLSSKLGHMHGGEYGSLARRARLRNEQEKIVVTGKICSVIVLLVSSNLALHVWISRAEWGKYWTYPSSPLDWINQKQLQLCNLSKGGLLWKEEFQVLLCVRKSFWNTYRNHGHCVKNVSIHIAWLNFQCCYFAAISILNTVSSSWYIVAIVRVIRNPLLQA